MIAAGERHTTLSTWAEQFLRAKRAEKLSRFTLVFYRQQLDHILKFCENKSIKHIESLTPDEIRAFLLEFEQEHNPGGVHAVYRTLRAFLLWFEQEAEPESWKNPVRKVRPPKVPEELRDPVPLADVECLVRECPHDYHGIRDKGIILTLLDTGIRARECCTLNLADVDLVMSEITIRQGKGKKPRVTFIGRRCKRAVKSWIKERGNLSGALFTTQEGFGLTYSGLRKVIIRRAALAGIDAPDLHDFRRAFTLAQLQSGVDVLSISRMLGHTTTVLVARYAKQTALELHEKYKSPVDEVEK
jgi:integrase/recombinase XerC